MANTSDRLFARIRKDDELLREHFTNIKQSDRSHEVRRLLEKAIKIESKEEEMLQKAKIKQEQDA